MAPSMASISLFVLLLCPAALLACPAACRCGAAGGGYEVRCSGAAVGTVPDGIPAQTTALWLTGTAMTALEPNKFSGLSSLRMLYVVDNTKLTDIIIGAFTGLTNLNELHMTGNQFKFVQPGTFYGLTNLKVLNLSGNIWSIAIATMFSGLPRLTTLNLSNNNITNMGDGPFSATLNALKVLDISSNNLSNIDVNVFSSWDSLQEVDVSGNLLEQPPVAHLEQAKNLKTLDVSRNPIKSLQANSFSKIKSLEVLKVNSMADLGNVQNNAFAGLYSLRRFEFVDNKGIKEFTLRHLPAHNNGLEEVDLSNNTFRTLERGLFMDRPNLTALTLNNLPLHCDCKLSWMGEAMSNTTRWPWAGAWKGLNATINGTDRNSTVENGPVCATPENLEEMRVGVMVKEDFTCDKAMFYNISTVNETTTNLTNTLTIKANLYPGLPSSLWLHPRGWYLKGSRDVNDTTVSLYIHGGSNITATETIDEDSRQVVAELTIDSVSVEDLGVYTLVATNAAGNSTQSFRVQLEDDSILSTRRPVSGVRPLQSTSAIFVVMFVLCSSKLFV